MAKTTHGSGATNLDAPEGTTVPAPDGVSVQRVDEIEPGVPLDPDRDEEEGDDESAGTSSSTSTDETKQSDELSPKPTPSHVRTTESHSVADQKVSSTAPSTAGNRKK